MNLLILTLAHATTTCEPASDHCMSPFGGCVYVQQTTSPPCITWDEPAGSIVALPGTELEVFLDQADR